MLASSCASPVATIAWPPAALISVTIASSVSGLRPVTATVKPPRAKRRAAATPSPRLAPTPTTQAMPRDLVASILVSGLI
jgi:hypothetical protein